MRVVRARNVVWKDGKALVEYFKDDEVTDEAHIQRLDALKALVPLDADDVPDPEVPASGSSPTGGTDGRITGDYASSDHTASALLAEVEARRADGRTIEVTGTGAGGNVLRGDLEKALAADDADQQP